MVIISSTANKWPQNHIDENEYTMESAAMLVEKPNQKQQQQQLQLQQHQQQQQQQTLKCPRCDSSNTKFCYYNNYSLSQPRHFCKACKRYWTRGGTLRNVPVGGVSRKNKRVKRPAGSTIDVASPVTGANTNSTPISQPQIDVSSSAHYVNPLFDLPFPRFRVSGVDTVTGYDIQPELSAPGPGLGFSSSYSNMFGCSSSSTTTTTTPATASLLASTLYQHKFMNDDGVKDKVQSRTEWNVPYQNQLDQIGSSDPTVYWNAPSIGAWHDPASIGSSVTSLI